MGDMYEPGTVAVVRYLDEDCRAMRTGVSSNMGWEIVRGDGSKTWAGDGSGYVTDVHPIVVLDLDGIDLIQLCNALARWKSWSSMTSEHQMLERLLAQIKAQAQPPRIPEPGLWGVVEAVSNVLPDGRCEYVRRDIEDPSWEDGSGDYFSWDDLIDPTLIREGLS